MNNKFMEYSGKSGYNNSFIEKFMKRNDFLPKEFAFRKHALDLILKKYNKKIIDFVRAYSVPTAEVNRSLAFYMDESGGDMEATAKHFLSNTGMWKKWVPADVAAKVADTL